MASDHATAPPHPDNQLAAASSLYLRQHAHQPLPWREWGADALAEAVRRDVPIFVSSGYSSCHWCHVMAHESFDDPRVGAELGERFVCVKVDREERPDVDAFLLDAVQVITGSGGWPLTAVLLPDGRPFWGGTYFPRTARQGMPGILDIARGIGDAWVERRSEIETDAARVEQGMTGAIARSFALPLADAGELSAQATTLDLVRACRAAALDQADMVHGGFGGAPKFPPPMTVELLLRGLGREQAVLGMSTKASDHDTREVVTRTLDAMLHGGIYDQVGGGFHRYAVDGIWLVPHFEKMLYDNAQLLRTYALAYRATGHARYARAVRETFAFLQRDLRLEGSGAYGSALDADTEGVEGTTYVWTREQLIAELGVGDGDRATQLLQAEEFGGNFEGSNVLSLAGEPSLATWGWWGEARERLLDARMLRPQPAFDTKAVAGWNGLLLGALADAWLVLGGGDADDPLLTAALELARHLRDVQVDKRGALRRTWHPGRGADAPPSLGAHAFAEDVADVSWGMLRLATATGDVQWFTHGRALAEQLIDEFDDAAEGGLFTASLQVHTDTLGRHKQLGDHPVPSATSQAALVWAELAHVEPLEPQWRGRSRAALHTLAGGMPRQPTHLAYAACALEALEAPSVELVIVAPTGTELGQPLIDAVGPMLRAAGADLFTGFELRIVFGREGDAHPALADRTARAGRVTAYLCQGMTCQAPTTDADELAA
ncbi:MAG: thioredoxin domain-containing protein, partial [Thermoleophilia bacterium]|nr:thioredoxin domain-containing protein [Thermoleophilia bacterium]